VLFWLGIVQVKFIGTSHPRESILGTCTILDNPVGNLPQDPSSLSSSLFIGQPKGLPPNFIHLFCSLSRGGSSNTRAESIVAAIVEASE